MTADLDLLRRAASRMRKLAEGARLWEMEDGSKRALGWHDVEELSGHPFDHAHAEYIAAWDPPTALAVADGLEYAAHCIEVGNDDLWTKHALAVARAFLKEASDV